MRVIDEYSVIHKLVDIPGTGRVICNGNGKDQGIGITCYRTGGTEFRQDISIRELIIKYDGITPTGITGRSDQLIHIRLCHHVGACFIPNAEIGTLATIDHLDHMVGALRHTGIGRGYVGKRHTIIVLQYFGSGQRTFLGTVGLLLGIVEILLNNRITGSVRAKIYNFFLKRFFHQCTGKITAHRRVESGIWFQVFKRGNGSD